MTMYPELDALQNFTVEEFQEDFDNLMNRVEGGEHIVITNGQNSAVMIPADDDLIKIYTELNNEAP